MPVVSAVTRADSPARIWAEAVVVPGSAEPPAHIHSAGCVALQAVRGTLRRLAHSHGQVYQDQASRGQASHIPTLRYELSTVAAHFCMIDSVIATAFAIMTAFGIAAFSTTAGAGTARLGLLGGDMIPGSGATTPRTIKAMSRTWLMRLR